VKALVIRSNPVSNVLKVNRMLSSNSTTNKYRARSECSLGKTKNHLKVSQDGIILTLNVSMQSQTYHTNMRTPLPMYRLTCTRHRGSSPSFDKTEANALHQMHCTHHFRRPLEAQRAPCSRRHSRFFRGLCRSPVTLYEALHCLINCHFPVLGCLYTSRESPRDPS